MQVQKLEIQNSLAIIGNGKNNRVTLKQGKRKAKSHSRSFGHSKRRSVSPSMSSESNSGQDVAMGNPLKHTGRGVFSKGETSTSLVSENCKRHRGAVEVNEADLERLTETLAELG